jgi:hypothetical protein
VDTLPQPEERKRRISALEWVSILLGIGSLFAGETPLGGRIAIAVVVGLMIIWFQSPSTLRESIIRGLVGLIVLSALLVLFGILMHLGDMFLYSEWAANYAWLLLVIPMLIAGLVDYFSFRRSQAKGMPFSKSIGQWIRSHDNDSKK